MLQFLPAIMGAVSKGLGIVDQLVEDKDLKAQLAVKQIELLYGLIEKLLASATVPWVDATVKLLMASVVFARPLGTFMMTAAGIYMHIKGIELDSAVHYALDGAFPAWGAAREVHKKREEETKRVVAQAQSNVWNNPFLKDY